MLAAPPTLAARRYEVPDWVFVGGADVDIDEPEDESPDDELLPDIWLEDDDVAATCELNAFVLINVQVPSSSVRTPTSVNMRTRFTAAWRRANALPPAAAGAKPLAGGCPPEAIVTSPSGLATQPST